MVWATLRLRIAKEQNKMISYVLKADSGRYADAAISYAVSEGRSVLYTVGVSARC